MDVQVAIHTDTLNESGFVENTLEAFKGRAIHTFHTSGGLLLRFPTLADQDWDFPVADLEAYRAIAEDGVAITGYANYAWEKKKIVDLMSPGHGVFNDWASKEFGVPAITTTMKLTAAARSWSTGSETSS